MECSTGQGTKIQEYSHEKPNSPPSRGVCVWPFYWLNASMTLRGLILWMYCTYCMCIHTLANACLSVFAGGHYCSPERVGKRDWDLFIFDSKEGVSYREFVITTKEKESWSTWVGLFLLLSVGLTLLSTCTMYTVCIACPCSAPLVRFHSTSEPLLS